MNQDSSTDRHCFTCGATAGAEDIYCRNCGSRLPAGPDRHPAESRESGQAAAPPRAGHSRPESGARDDDDTIYVRADPDQETASRESIRVDDEESQTSPRAEAPPITHPYAPREPQAPPRSSGSNRVWWIVGAVILLFILLCCCMVMLIALVAGSDNAFQDELQSVQPIVGALAALVE